MVCFYIPFSQSAFLQAALVIPYALVTEFSCSALLSVNAPAVPCESKPACHALNYVQRRENIVQITEL